MRYRELGRTGLKVSEIGLGSWGIGGQSSGSTSYGHIETKTAVNTIEKALDLGVNFFDTSNVYGDGQSEKLLGMVLKKCRSDVVISTKVGLATFVKKINLNAKEIENSLNNSLNRLKTEYVDVLHLHKVSATEIERNQSIIGTLQGLITKGKIRHFAISLNNPSEARIPVISDNFPIVQTNLSLLDMRLLQEGLIQFADNNKLAIIARTPFNFGFLAKSYMKGTRFQCPDHRSLWSQQTIDHWIDGANIVYGALGHNELTDTRQRVDLAIQFCLAFRPVSSVLVGALNESEMAMNVAASSAPPLSKNQLELVFNAYKSWEQGRVDC